MDLFEQYETLPQPVKTILDKYAEMENDYEACGNLVNELNTVGYTCEYGLDADPFNLRRIMKKGDLYFFEEIERFSTDEGMNSADFSLTEHGKFLIGQQMLILEHNDKDIVMTFVLTGMQGGTRAVYECIYTDLDTEL